MWGATCNFGFWGASVSEPRYIFKKLKFLIKGDTDLKNAFLVGGSTGVSI